MSAPAHWPTELPAHPPLAPIDRGLGAAFGFLRGLVILLALVLLVGWTAWGCNEVARATVGRLRPGRLRGADRVGVPGPT